ncbi:MAG: hypothetical protein PVJ38_01250 [Candidatus Bathyarchaeota archaeon]
MSTRRKMLAADEALANRIVEVAKRKDSTVYRTVNEILEQALRADAMGLILSDIIDNREKLEKAREMGFTLTVERLLYDVVDLANDKAGKELEELWLETGRWYGRYFTDRDGDPIDDFREAMSLLTLGNPVSSIEKMRDGKLSVSCVGELYTEGYTEMYSLFIQGVMETLGWEQVETMNSEGIIRLTFEKTG